MDASRLNRFYGFVAIKGQVTAVAPTKILFPGRSDLETEAVAFTIKESNNEDTVAPFPMSNNPITMGAVRATMLDQTVLYTISRGYDTKLALPFLERHFLRVLSGPLEGTEYEYMNRLQYRA